MIVVQAEGESREDATPDERLADAVARVAVPEMDAPREERAKVREVVVGDVDGPGPRVDQRDVGELWVQVAQSARGTARSIVVGREAAADPAVEIVDYATYKAHQDKDLTELAWLYNMNRGIFMTPGREEEWTLSVVHSGSDVDRYVAVFEEMANELVRGPASD